MSLASDHPLMVTAREGKVDELKEIITPVGAFTDKGLSGAAMEAAKCGQIQVLRALSDGGWDVRSNSAREGSSILMYTLRNKKEDIASWLLSQGADPNATSEDGTAALTITAMYCSLTMTSTLLDHGAGVPGSRALIAAAVSQQPDRCEKLSLLLERGAKVNDLELELPWQTQSGRTRKTGTALHAACRWGFEDSEAFLLDHGADPELQDSDGRTPGELKSQQKGLAARGWSRAKVSETARREIARQAAEEKKQKSEEQSQHYSP